MPDNAGHSEGFIVSLVCSATWRQWSRQPLLRLTAARGQGKELGFEFAAQAGDFFVH